MYLQQYIYSPSTEAQSEAECGIFGKGYWKTFYFQIIDSVIVNLKYFFFSDESIVLANLLYQFLKMDFKKGSYIINHYKVSILFRN